MLRVLPVAIAHFFFLTFLSAQTTFYVVRHADRAPGNDDPPISETGQVRAKALARLLTDAPLGAIFVTEAVRTQQTAAPTASAHHLPAEIVPAKDIARLMRRIKEELPLGKSALVVGHRGTVPRIVEALGGGAIPPLGSSEVDRMTAVTCWPDGKCAVLVFRYGPE